MAEIHQLVGIKASPAKVYSALATKKGLKGWWTKDVRGSEKKGGELEFWFDDMVQPMKVLDTRRNRSVRWKPRGGYGFGGEILFKLERKKGETIVRFTHKGWRKQDFFFAFVSTKWATFLLSLKDYMEKGRGRPFPRDTYVMHGDIV
jgi:uncharacterized protein YndB with AHSA1/START domain